MLKKSVKKELKECSIAESKSGGIILRKLRVSSFFEGIVNSFVDV